MAIGEVFESLITDVLAGLDIFSRKVLPQRFFFLVFTLAGFLTDFLAAGLA